MVGLGHVGGHVASSSRGGRRADRQRHRSASGANAPNGSERAGSSPARRSTQRAATSSLPARSAASISDATIGAARQRGDLRGGEQRAQPPTDSPASSRARDPLRARLHRQRRRASSASTASCVGYDQARAYERTGRIEDTIGRVLAEAAAGITRCETADLRRTGSQPQRPLPGCETPAVAAPSTDGTGEPSCSSGSAPSPTRVGSRSRRRSPAHAARSRSRRPAAARARARLYEGPPHRPTRARDGRGLVPDAGDRGRRERPRRPRHLPRPRPAGRLSDPRSGALGLRRPRLRRAARAA